MAHFKIITPFYNVSHWVTKTVNSVLDQTYEDFQMILIDDLSTDDSLIKARQAAGSDGRFTFHRNIEKRYALGNIIMGIEMANPSDEDIIVLLDGDDWFSDRKVLSLLNRVYDQNSCWVTYGSYVNYPSGRPGHTRAYPAEVIENALFRDYDWLASHTRTFKYWLWNRVKDEDLRDSQGVYFRFAWDLVIMLPMLEMAGEKQCFLSDITYVYNRENPLSDYKVDREAQLLAENEIRKKARYEKVEPEIRT